MTNVINLFGNQPEPPPAEEEVAQDSGWGPDLSGFDKVSVPDEIIAAAQALKHAATDDEAYSHLVHIHEVVAEWVP